MNYGELVNSIKDMTGIPKTKVKEVLETLIITVKEHPEVSLPGLGKFKWKVRPARTARNPITGESVAVGEKSVLAFKPTKPARTK